MISYLNILLNKNFIPFIKNLVKNSNTNIRCNEIIYIFNIFKNTKKFKIKRYYNNKTIFKLGINIGKYNNTYDLIIILTQCTFSICFAFNGKFEQSNNNLNNITISSIRKFNEFVYILGIRMVNMEDKNGIRTSGKESINIILSIAKILKIKKIYLSDDADMNCFFNNSIKIKKISLLRLLCGKKGYYESLGANYVNKEQVEKVKIFLKTNILPEHLHLCNKYLENRSKVNCVDINEIIAIYSKKLEKKDLLKTLYELYFII
jgi:hypothetical protein